MHDDINLANMYITKSKRAKRDGTEFSISFALFKKLHSRKICAYSGLRFSEKDQNHAWKNPWLGLTIDRIDNSKGYIDGNVVAVCNGVNNLKAQWEDPKNPLSEKLTIKIITKLALVNNKLDILE